MLNFLNLKPEAFGLDISDLSLKIVKLKKKGKFFDLASFGETKIRPNIVKEGEVRSEKALARAIRNAISKVKGEKLRTRYVVASLPEEKAFLQVITLPKMSLEDLRSAIVYQAENYIPLPIEKVYLDFKIVPPVYDHLDHLDVLIVAFPKETVDSYLSSLKQAGLKPLVFEVESQAISQALIPNGVTTFPVLLIDLGATRTGFVVFSGYSLRFTTSIQVCSNSFTEIIARNLGVSLNRAEKLKIKYGLGKKVKLKIKDRAERRFEPGRINEILMPAMIDLVEQIQRYIDYYQTHAAHEHLPPPKKGETFKGRPDHNRIRKIFLCGGGANLKGFPKFLSHYLKIPVEIGNPWVNILPEPQKEQGKLSLYESLKYTTALGLALRGVKEK